MATPQRLPIVNSDDGTWGDIIRQYLMKEHYNDDTDNAVNGGHQKITVRAGTATAGTAPLKFTSGTLLATPEAGAVEFNSDNLYFTITTSALRKKIAMYDDSSGATGDTYYRDSSGNFTRLGIGSSGQALKVASGLPAWGNPMNFVAAVKTSNYTLTSSDTVVFVNATSGNVTITLPAASTVTGYRFYIKRIDGASNKATIACSGSDTMDGLSSMLLVTQYDAVEVVSNGSTWYLLNFTNQVPANSVVYRGTSSAVIVSSSITCSIPSGVVSGDVMIAYYTIYSASSATFTPPSGWTAIGSQAIWAGTSPMVSQAYYKVATNSEPSSYTFTTSTSSGTTDIAIVAYYGVDTTNPIDTSSTNSGRSTTRTGTGVTTTTGYDKVILATQSFVGAISTPPSGMVGRGFWDGTGYFYEIDVPAIGSTGSYTATESSTDSWTTKVIALRAAPASSGTPDATPIGTITMFASILTAPAGWTLCDGSAISRTVYSALFSIIGTTYGAGDGSTTFNLPNLKGSVPVGYDSTQTEFNTMGKTGGEKTHQLTVAEMPSHSHTLGNGGNALTDGPTGTTYFSAAGPDFGFRASSITNTGGGGSHNNLQPYVTLSFIIKVL